MPPDRLTHTPVTVDTAIVTDKPTPAVRIQTVDLDVVGSRQISTKVRTTGLLAERRPEIEAGIQEAIEMVKGSLAKDTDRHGWQVSSVEATFGITVTAEAGVVLTKASAEASFEVKLTVERVD